MAPEQVVAVAAENALMNVALALMPPSTCSFSIATPASASAASSRSAPRCAMPHKTALTISARVVDADQVDQEFRRAPKSHTGVPIPPSAGTKVTPPASKPNQRRVGSCCVVDDAEAVPQPFDARSGGKHDGFDAPRSFAISLPGSNRKAAAVCALQRRASSLRRNSPASRRSRR